MVPGIDWAIIAAFFRLLLIGVCTSKKQEHLQKNFSFSGKKYAWWLLGVSNGSNYFLADIPNLVTDHCSKKWCSRTGLGWLSY